ncbi:MAG TPA: DUF3152 domain-containing protein [Actinomycetota bacterium]
MGATIAVTFGFAAGLLAMRWTAAEALQPTAGPSGPSPQAVQAAAEPVTIPVSEPVEPTPQPAREPTPLLRRTCGAEGARVIRWRAAVGPGLDTTPRAFARGVAEVLCNPKGWIAGERVAFRYDPRGPVLIRLASAAETERRCLQLTGLSVRLMWSCASGSRGEVVLNANRWFEGSPSWPGGPVRYRRMLVNHEVGHILGHGHRACGAPGSAAPVMMQQSKGLGGCRPNPWPTRAELAGTH